MIGLGRLGGEELSYASDIDVIFVYDGTTAADFAAAERLATQLVGAIGDILRDQLYYLHACGFNAFAVRADRDLADALKGLVDFSDNYQSTVEQPVPLFRRRDTRVSGSTPA